MRPGGKADPVARHTETLGNTVYRYHTALVPLQFHGPYKGLPVIHKPPVYLVRHAPNAPLPAYIHKGLQLLPAVKGAGGVVGIVQDQSGRPGGNSPQQISFRKLVQGPGALHQHGGGSRQQGHLIKAGVAGHGDKYLVPRPRRAPQGRIDQGLGPGGYGHMGRIRSQKAGGGLLHKGRPGSGGVSGKILPHRLQRPFLPGGSGGLYGFSGRQIQNALPGQRHLLGQCVQLHDQGGLYPGGGRILHWRFLRSLSYRSTLAVTSPATFRVVYAISSTRYMPLYMPMMLNGAPIMPR